VRIPWPRFLTSGAREPAWTNAGASPSMNTKGDAPPGMAFLL